MRRSMIIWLSIGLGLVILGALLFAGIMMLNKWNFSMLDSVKYESNTYEFTEEIKDININVDTAKIEIRKSEDGACKIECYEYEKSKHETKIEDGTLSIKVNNTRKWYDYITIFDFGSPKITVYLPKDQYGNLEIKGSTGAVKVKEEFTFENADIKLSTGNTLFNANVLGDLKIKTSTGDIHVTNVSVGATDLSVSTGDIYVAKVKCDGILKISVSTGKSLLDEVECQSLVSTGDTGDISMINVVAKEKLDITRSTGDVSFDRCDAGEIFIKTDTGDVKGSLSSEKIFIYETDTGRVKLPHSTSGGKCEISTDTGDIIISIVK